MINEKKYRQFTKDDFEFLIFMQRQMQIDVNADA